MLIIRGGVEKISDWIFYGLVDSVWRHRDWFSVSTVGVVGERRAASERFQAGSEDSSWQEYFPNPNIF